MISQYGIITAKRFGNRVKLSLHKGLMAYSPGSAYKRRPGYTNEEKLAASISRTRGRIYELAACNPWKWFVTLTLDGELRDRFDLKAFRRDLAQYVRNQKRLHGWDIKYLLIPEQHKDGAWHMHGLIDGLPDEALRVNANGYYEWAGVRDRFGFTSLSKVRSHEAVAAYITKYITKDIAQRASDLGEHLFFASNGLASAEPIGEYHEKYRDAISWDYENDYTAICWVSLDDFGLFLSTRLTE